MLAARPQGGLVQQRVLVERGVIAQRLEWVAVAEDRLERRAERLREVQVDGAHGAMEIHGVVHEQARREEHLERAQPRLVQGEPPVGHERVTAEPVGVDGTACHARNQRVAPDVVEVVDGEDAGEQRLEAPNPQRHGRVGQGWLRHQEADPARVDALAFGEGRPLGIDRRGAPQPVDQGSQFALDDGLAQVLVRQALAWVAAWMRRRGPARQDVLVEEVGEGAVTHVVQQAGHPKRLHDQRLRRDRVLGRLALGSRAVVEDVAQRGVQRGAPEAGLMHHPERVDEAGMLGAREDPARALQLADPPHALEPLRVEEVLLGHVLGREEPARTDWSGVSRFVSSMYP